MECRKEQSLEERARCGRPASRAAFKPLAQGSKICPLPPGKVPQKPQLVQRVTLHGLIWRRHATAVIPDGLLGLLLPPVHLREWAGATDG
jgi:hypothetical protein